MASQEYGKMSESLKMRLIDELGYGATVRREGDFGSVPARECGNMVKLAIRYAQQALARGGRPPGPQ